MYTQKSSNHYTRTYSHHQSLAKSSQSYHEGCDIPSSPQYDENYPHSLVDASSSRSAEGWFGGYDFSLHTDLVNFANDEDFLEWENHSENSYDDDRTTGLLSEYSAPHLED